MTPYTVYVTPSAIREIKELPGHVRQRVRRAIDDFAAEPRPPKSKALQITGATVEVRRLQLDRWRILYAVDDSLRIVDVFAVRKRPPYDYGDLADLLNNLPKN